MERTEPEDRDLSLLVNLLFIPHLWSQIQVAEKFFSPQGGCDLP